MTDPTEIRRRPDGSIDTAFYTARGRQARGRQARHLAGAIARRLGAGAVAAAALVLAAAALPALL